MMDRIAERIRMGQEDAKMLAAIDQASLDALAQAIVDANSVDVDGVSGATLTSGRIKDAAVKCLTQAAQ